MSKEEKTQDPPDIIICPDCGYQLNSQEHFCPNCGHSFLNNPLYSISNEELEKRNNQQIMSIISLVLTALGIFLGPLLPIISIVLSSIVLNSKYKPKGTTKVFSLCSLIGSIIYLVIFLIILILFIGLFFAESNTSYQWT